MPTENVDTEVIQDAEVLPPTGNAQFALDWGFRAGQFLKRNVIAVGTGILLGVLICYVINAKTRN